MSRNIADCVSNAGSGDNQAESLTAYDFGLGTADDGDVTAIVNNRNNTRTQYFSYNALNWVVLANTQPASGANA